MNRIGIDIGGTFIKGGIVSDNGNILHHVKLPTMTNVSKEAIINNIYKIITMLLLENDLKYNEKISFIGMGVPGMVSRKTGIAEFSGNLNWENVPIISELVEKGITIPMLIYNDSRVAAIGETLFGAGKNFNNFIVMTIGTGIGAGIIQNRKIYEGNGDKGGEVGHEVIVVDGEKCTCSRNGCFEAYASGRALIRDTKREMEKNKSSLMWKLVDYNINNVDGNTAFDAAKEGDVSAIFVVNKYVKYLSEGILNICNAFRPEAIILGGGIAEQGDYLIDKVRSYIKEKHYGYKYTPKVEVFKAELGNKAGIVGAAFIKECLNI